MSSSDILHVKGRPAETLELNTRFYPRQFIEAALRELPESAQAVLSDAGPERVRLTFQGQAAAGRAFANRVLALVREGR
jgi:hypothetical protein